MWMSSILSSFLLSTWSLLFFPDCSCSCWCLWYGIHGLHFKSIHWYAVLSAHVFFVFELFISEPNHFDCHITLSGHADSVAFFLNLNVISFPLLLFPFLFCLPASIRSLMPFLLLFLNRCVSWFYWSVDKWRITFISFPSFRGKRHNELPKLSNCASTQLLWHPFSFLYWVLLLTMTSRVRNQSLFAVSTWLDKNPKNHLGYGKILAHLMGSDFFSLRI